MTATARNGERNIVIERATQRPDIRDVSDHQQHHPPTPRQPWTSTSTAAGFVEQSDGHAGAPHCAGNDGLLGRLVSDSGGVLGHGPCDAGAAYVDAGRWRTASSPVVAQGSSSVLPEPVSEPKSRRRLT